MLIKKGRLLVVSLHLSGGCFYYSNHLIENLNMPKSVYTPKKVCEDGAVRNANHLYFYGYNSVLRYLSLFCFLIRIFVGGVTGYYNKLLLCGYTSWDPYIMRVWRLTRRPSFFIVHDGKLHLGNEAGPLQEKLVVTMKRSTCLIFLSNYVRELVRKNFAISKPSYIAPHGLIDYGDLSSETGKNKKNILFLGRVDEYKGIDLLIDAVNRIEDCDFTVTIAGKWSIKRPDCMSTRFIIIDKWLTTEEIRKHVQDADIMVMPYKEATQSGVATVAINYCVPVIATDVGAFSEQFNGMGSVLIKPDSEELAIAIKDLVEDRYRLISMKKQMAVLRENYKWSEISEGLKSYISEW